MSDTHQERVKSMASKLAQLSTAATTRLNTVFYEVYALASSRMEAKLGSSGYGNYVALFDTSDYSRDEEFFELNKAQRKLRMLETAEAYYLLYYFVLSLKQLENKNVILEESKFGEGKIQPSEIESLIEMRNEYLREGDSICGNQAETYGMAMASV